MSMQTCSPPSSVAPGSHAAEAALFKALSDPHRATILATLARSIGEVCVCDITSILPLNQPAVSHHMKILRDAGLTTCVRRGTWVYYRLAIDARARIASALNSVFPEETVI